MALSVEKCQKSFKKSLFLTILCTGGALNPPPKVLVSGSFQSDLRDPGCWHNSYMIMRFDFMKKNSKIFFNFFQFFEHPSHKKRFFCTFGPKITYSYILRGQHIHLTPKKCFLEAYSTKCPGNYYAIFIEDIEPFVIFVLE